jgi:suppressor of G2 allele of SKP1
VDWSAKLLIVSVPSATTPHTLLSRELTRALSIVLSKFPTITTSPGAASAGTKPFYKNWDGITTRILEDDKPRTTNEDPNAGGDAAVNKFFQEIYGNADENTKRAMMKSFVESGGTTLSTNWEDVGKAPVEVKPPQGSEWKKWGE